MIFKLRLILLFVLARLEAGHYRLDLYFQLFYLVLYLFDLYRLLLVFLFLDIEVSVLSVDSVSLEEAGILDKIVKFVFCQGL